MTEYKCPHCGSNYNKKQKKNFDNQRSLSAHISKCKLNPVYLKEKIIKPKVGIFAYKKEDIIIAIQKFFQENKRIPYFRDFQRNPKYPGRDAAIRLFGSWNKAIEASGFTPNIQTGFGVNTLGKDGILYASAVEAYFSDNFLFSKFDYIYEPSYPDNSGRKFDFYVPALSLFIEINGEIKDENFKYLQKIKEKEQFCRDKNINCIFILKSAIYKKDFKLTRD